MTSVTTRPYEGTGEYAPEMSHYLQLHQLIQQHGLPPVLKSSVPTTVSGLIDAVKTRSEIYHIANHIVDHATYQTYLADSTTQYVEVA